AVAVGSHRASRIEYRQGAAELAEPCDVARGRANQVRQDGIVAVAAAVAEAELRAADPHQGPLPQTVERARDGAGTAVVDDGEALAGRREADPDAQVSAEADRAGGAGHAELVVAAARRGAVQLDHEGRPGAQGDAAGGGQDAGAGSPRADGDAGGGRD